MDREDLYQPFEANSHLELLRQNVHSESFSMLVASVQGLPELCWPGVSLVPPRGPFPEPAVR